MAELLMLTPESGGSAQVLAALALLPHRVRVVPLEASALLDAPDSDIVLIDGRRDLAKARATCQLMRSTGIDVPLLLVITEGGLPVIGTDWGISDVVLADAGPAEVDARLRLIAERDGAPATEVVQEIEAGELMIDAGGYTAKLRGSPLDLTYKEFELLKYLSQHPGRVFTRAQLLQEVWGYDYFGGTRTVDVHIRRLRAKLGPEHDSMIGTVRNVGYRFESQRDRQDADASEQDETSDPRTSR
ncbi:MAG: winged-helix domain-containing protein [Beutenbergiaceae bacterium]